MKKLIKQHWDNLRINIREKLNPYLGKYRAKKLKRQDFTIISNNCWGGHVYRYFAKGYNSPTIGLFIFAEDYLRFLKDLRHYISSDLSFIKRDQSIHKAELESMKVHDCPIGKIDDVEIFFLHYKSEEEARDKWKRRASRICWDNIYVKMSMQNSCTEEHVKEFDKLPYKNKIIFTTKDLGILSQIIWKDRINEDEIPNDTTTFRKYINLIEWINCKSNYKLNQ